MKIVHLADTHLGFRQLHKVNEAGRNWREQDVYDSFRKAIEKIVELKPAAVVHAGDLFDSFHPASAALNVALDGFQHLHDSGIPAVVIGGNHSTPRLASADHVFAVLERFGGVNVIYREAQTVRLGDLAIHAVPHMSAEEAVAAALQAARPDAKAKFNVLTAHVGLTGLSQVTGPESGSITVSGEALSEADDFDYIALGHLHEFQSARDNAAYAGSLDRLNWADASAERNKGIVEVDLVAGRSSPDFLRLHPIPCRRRVHLPPVNAAAEDDLAAAIAERARSADINDAIVRLIVENVSASEWSALDWRPIKEAFSASFHRQILPDLVAGPAVAGAVPPLHDFLRAWAGSKKGIDAEEMIKRADRYLAKADHALESK